MTAEIPAVGDDEARQAHHPPFWRGVSRQLAYLAATLVAVAAVALALSTTAAALQAGRNEARNADLVVVVAPAIPSQALIDHSFELYRRGYGPQIAAVGAGGEGLSSALRERGVAESALVNAAGDSSELAQMRAILLEARAAGAATVLIAGDGAEMLRWLKVASDVGLSPYGTPTPGQVPNPLELLAAGGRYWRYVLLQG